MKYATGKLLAAASLAIGLSPLASAGLLDIQGGYQIQLPVAAHDVAETKGAHGWYGANLYTSAQPQPVYLTFEFLGYEAGWKSEFAAYGSTFVNKTTVPGSKFYGTESGGTLLDFAFNVLSGDNAGFGVDNGSNVGHNVLNPATGYGLPNFFLGCVGAAAGETSCDSVYITLDDGGSLINGEQIDDDNHDDLVVKVTARVPEPASVALLGLGLVGLGVARRRHSA